jgi:hypothetical protein
LLNRAFHPHGMRDFTLLYLAAAYGLRSSELVRLTLDYVDWHGRTLLIAKRKSRHALQLPLTDEAANILINYLRKARPQSSHRQLFLRMRAPAVRPIRLLDVHDLREVALPAPAPIPASLATPFLYLLGRANPTHLGLFVFEPALKLGEILLIQILCFLLKYP